MIPDVVFSKIGRLINCGTISEWSIQANKLKMNEEDLHLAQAMVEMGLEDQPQTPKKTLISRVQEKVQGFRWVDGLHVPW